MQKETNNRFSQNLQGGRTSVGAVVTMSDLVVSELAGRVQKAL